VTKKVRSAEFANKTRVGGSSSPAGEGVMNGQKIRIVCDDVRKL
jgi:hypothetical protein